MSKQPTQPDDWSAESEALFEAARGAHVPTAANRERVRNALAHKLAAASGAPATGGDVQPGATGPGASNAALGKLAKVGLGAACALATAVAFMRADDSRERTEAKSNAVQTVSSGARPEQRTAEPDVAVGDPPAPSSVALAPAAGPPSQAAPTVRPSARRSGAPPVPAKVSVSEPAPERSQTDVQDQPASIGTQSRPSLPTDAPQKRAEDTTDARAELELVTRINAAARQSKPLTVFALCAEHERRWPRGVFEQEREGARAIASCSSKLPEAGARARAFLARHPRTAIAARVREECAPLLTADAKASEDLPVP